MQVIPAIDLLDGKIVRLSQGDFSRVDFFGDDPLPVVENYRRLGADRLHLVNLSAARDGAVGGDFIRQITRLSQVLPVQVGGGARDLHAVRLYFEAGAAAVIVGTMLFADPDAVAAAVLLFGGKSIVAALDVDGVRETVRIRGWRDDSGMSIWEAAERVRRLGPRQVLVTDISRDGMAAGPNVSLYAAWKRRFPDLAITASGGVRDARDIDELERADCDSVVVGRALLDHSVAFSALVRGDLQKEKQEAALPGSHSTKRAGDNNRGDLAIRVIPCLDVDRGRVVKGTNFQNLRDAGDPVELARRYCDEGADELVFLDITATCDFRPTVVELASRVAAAVNIPFTIGGGVRSADNARRLLEAGADKVAVNSAAVARPELLEEMSLQLGAANTVCAIDARRDRDGWTVLTRGGRNDARCNAIAWAERAVWLGAGELLVTSHDRDGTSAGFDTELLAEIKRRVSVSLIASGGGGSPQSFIDAVRVGRADAVLAAGVFHFGVLSIQDVKAALRGAGIPIRP